MNQADIERVLASYQTLEWEVASDQIQNMPLEQLTQLVEVASRGWVEAEGSPQFLHTLACSSRTLNEDILEKLAFCGTAKVRLATAYRPDLVGAPLVAMALEDLYQITQGEDAALAAFSSPNLPSWLMGVAYQLASSENYSDSEAGGMLAYQLVRNDALPVVAKAKLTDPRVPATLPWNGWVTETNTNQLLPAVADQVAAEFPELADLPVALIVETLRTLPLPDSTWGEVPAEYAEEAEDLTLAGVETDAYLDGTYL